MALVSLEGELGLLVSKVSLLGGPCPQRSEGCADRDQAVPLNCSHRIAWMDAQVNATQPKQDRWKRKQKERKEKKENEIDEKNDDREAAGKCAHRQQRTASVSNG